MKFSRSIIVGIIILMVVLVVLAIPRIMRHQDIRDVELLLERELPSETRLQATSYKLQAPSEVNLPVPFTVQAPHGDWGMPYQEACEEAAALMAIRYAFGNVIEDKEDADAAIKDLVKANEEILKYPIDQTASQVKDLIVEIDPIIPVRLIDNPGVSDLKKELAQGNVIIVPAAGRMLKNPFFRRPGPVYHMLVVRGYTEDGYFITNDPGTKRGEGYLYTFDRIMDAMHDWNDGDVEDGEKRVLVVESI